MISVMGWAVYFMYLPSGRNRQPDHKGKAFGLDANYEAAMTIVKADFVLRRMRSEVKCNP